MHVVPCVVCSLLTVKQYLYIIPLIGLVIFTGGCSPEEPLVNSFDDTWRLLVSGPGEVYTVDMPSGLNKTTVWKPTDASGTYPVQRLQEYRDNLYLLRSNAEIVVLQRSNLQASDTIALPGMASGIAFANATTAYVAIPSEQSVAIVDLTINSVVSSIPLNAVPSDIVALGNQICVLVPELQEARIIDSRTNAVEATIPLPTPSPQWVRADALGGVFCIVMKGAGKDAGSTETPTAPMLSALDVTKRSIVASVALTSRESEGPKQLPHGIVVNASGFCYVPVQNGLLQAASRSPKRAAAVQFEAYYGIWYDAARARMYCSSSDGRTITAFDEFAEKVVTTVSLPDSTNALLGIAP